MIFRHLPFFVAAAEEEHIQRAAKRLNMSQSALSRRIHELELELGVRLFERVRSGVRLTALGRVFRDDARRIINDLDRATRRLERLALGASGLIRIGFNENAVRHRIVTDAFQLFRSDHPEAELRLVPMGSGQQIAALRAGEIDAGFVYHGRGESPELEWREIKVDDRFVLALAADHKLAQRKDIRLADLQDEDFIWPSETEAPSVVYGQLMAACHLAGLKPRIVLEAGHSDTTLTFVAAGAGLGFVPLAQQGRQPSNIVLRRVMDLDLPLHLDLVWNRGDVSPVLKGFVETVETLQGAYAQAPSPKTRKAAKKSRSK